MSLSVILIGIIFLIVICLYSEIKLRFKLKDILDKITGIQKTVEYEYLDIEDKDNLNYMKDRIIWYLHVRRIKLFVYGEENKNEERKIMSIYKMQYSDEYFKYLARKLIEAPINGPKCRDSV